MIVATGSGLVGIAAPAGAHATVVTSDPADGAQLEASPVSLTFDLSEAVSPVEDSTQVIDADGNRYPLAAPRLENGRQRIVLDVPATLPDGAYLATARVVSADTHVVSLSVRFTVGDVTSHGDWGAVSGEGAVVDRAVLLPVKAVSYVGLVLSAGLFLAGRWAWPDVAGTPRCRVIHRIGAALLSIGLLGRFGVLVAEQAGGVGNAAWSSVTTIAGTPFGTLLLVATGLSILAAGVTAPPLHLAQALAAVAAVTLGGHGAATELWPLPLIATFLHVYAIAVWLGGLGVIMLNTKSIPQLGRWHRVVVVHVGLAVLAGVVLALLQVRPANALVATSYGVTLAVKIVLVAATVLAGYVAFRAYRKPAGGGRTVRVETAFALAVIAVTSSLSSLTPAKDSYTTNVATRLDFGGSEILDVDIDTVRRGAQVVTVTYADEYSNAEVGVEFSSAAANVARMPVLMSAAEPEDGTVTWRSEGLIVPSAGRWKVTVRFVAGGAPKLASFYYEAL